MASTNHHQLDTILDGTPAVQPLTRHDRASVIATLVDRIARDPVVAAAFDALVAEERNGLDAPAFKVGDRTVRIPKNER